MLCAWDPQINIKINKHMDSYIYIICVWNEKVKISFYLELRLNFRTYIISMHIYYIRSYSYINLSVLLSVNLMCIHAH